MFQFRRQHTAHCRFHFVDQVIDDGVVTQIQAFRFNYFTCRGISTYVEANQDGVGRRSQGSVGFGDTTYARTDDLHFNFVSRQFQQGVGDSFHRTLYVCLQDDIHFVNFAFGHVGEHVLEFRFLLTRQFNFAEFTLTIECNFTRFLLVTYNGNFITRSRNAGQAEDFHRNGRTRFQHFLTQFVAHRTNTTVFEATQNDIALVQSTFTYQNGSNRTTTFIEEGFDNRTARHTFTYRFQFQNFRLQQDSVQQFIDTSTRFRRHMYELAFTAPLFRQDAVLGEFVLNAIRIGFWFIDLVHCNHHRNLRRFRVLDCFDGLRHYAVVGSNNQDYDVRCLRTTSTH